MKRKITLSFLIVLLSVSSEQAQTVNTAVIDATNTNVHKISRFIYSHFSEHLGNCIYGGLWVGEDSAIPNNNGLRTDVVDALNRIKVPALRWPGGCFADEYHWRDGIGPRSLRPEMINTNWGGVTEDNSFGTHEFMELCDQLNCEAYISGNLGSGTVREMSQWVEYLNSDNESPMTELRKANGRDLSWGVQFWGVGNESWGCGGRMRPGYYIDRALHYSAFLKNYGDHHLKLIAVGPNADDYNWTDVVMGEMRDIFWGLALHYYTNLSSSATQFKEDEWFQVMKQTLKMEELVSRHSEIMDKNDPLKSVALVVDEWGTWYQVEPGTNPGFLFQQNSLRDALVAGINLNIFNNHCDRVRMTAIAQVVNVLQSVILTREEKMLLTPTYHVFDMYKVHQDAYMLPTTLNTENYSYGDQSVPALNISSSLDKNGKMHVSICNLHANKTEKLVCSIKGFTPEKGNGEILTASRLNAYNSFDHPDNVTIGEFSGFRLNRGKLEIDMPPHSVVMVELEGNLISEDNTVEVNKPVKGLSYQLYKGIYYKLSDFKSALPDAKGVIGTVSFPEESGESNFGVVYQGYFKAEESGIYNFNMLSDDGSKLSIDNRVIIDIDGRHGIVEQDGIIYLHKGYHLFELSYFQAGGGRVLKLNLPGKDGELVPLTGERLWHEKK